MTIRKFYRITGASTQLKGVVPDIILPDTLSYADVVSERTLENALPWDTIPPEDYNKLNLVFNKLNLVQPYLPLLRERSDTRVATNQDFVYVRQDITELQKLQGDKAPAGIQNQPVGADGAVKMEADTVATLNEHEALKEREKIIAENKAREEERAKRKEPDEKIYELTVENCDQPGLPPILGQTNEVAAAGMTNAVIAANGKEPPPPFDPMLDESKNILEDYISLLTKSNMLIANHLDL